MRHPELLIPAGDLETLKIAVMYGADAVYVGGELFSLRAKAKNFTIEELKEGVEFAHAHGVRVYIAFNIFAFHGEIEEARAYLVRLREVMPDAFIVSDLSLIEMMKEIIPEAEIHVSTQWNNSNYETFNFWYALGARKVVVARELSIAEIKEIRAHIPEDILIESFIILSHAPLEFLNENCPFFNIYGHVHNDPRYLDLTKNGACVSIERTEYKPIKLEELKKQMEVTK